MKPVNRGPILAFSLICITTYIYGMDGIGTSTPPHVITVRDGMSGSSSDESSPLNSSRNMSPSVRLDDLQDIPGFDDSEEMSMTSHQMAQRYLSHFSGDTTIALPHMVAVLEADKKVKSNLGRCMHVVTRGGIQPLFVRAEELIGMESPRGTTRNFLDDMKSALPIAQSAVDPVIQALTKTSTELETAKKENTDLTTANTALKTNANYKAAAWTAVGSVATLFISAGLTMLSTYVGSLTPAAPQAIECILTLTNSTLGG